MAKVNYNSETREQVIKLGPERRKVRKSDSQGTRNSDKYCSEVGKRVPQGTQPAELSRGTAHPQGVRRGTPS